MVFRVEVVGIPHYADVNPPPAGTVLPTGSRAATVAEVDAKSSTGAVFDSNTDTWIIPSPAAGGTGGGTGGGGGSGGGTGIGGISGSGAWSASTGTSFPTLDTMVVTAPTDNPLEKYASYTYNWTLWWLSSNDYSTLASFRDVSSAQSFEPTVGSSYVIAEDSSLYPDRRLPATSGLNYHIHSVEFMTTAAHNDKTWHTNLINGTIIVKEPYGVTLMDSLVLGSFMNRAAGDPVTNYTDQPFMLELNFTGYDDNGVPMPAGETGIFRKRFPIKIIGIKIDVGAGGATYRISFVPMNHIALHEEHANIPKTMSVKGGTVNEFFQDLSSQLATYWHEQVDTGKAMYADGMQFEFDPSIANSSIIYNTQTSISDASPDGITIDLTKKQFTISEGTKIVDLINKVITLSKYVSEQLKLHGGLNSDHAKPLNVFKTMVSTQLAASTSADDPTAISFAVYDPVKNQYPRIIHYRVHQFITYGISHPSVDQAPDSRNYTVKKYEYLYSGNNKSVINVKLNFDTSYYTPVMSYKDIFASYQATQDTKVEGQLAGRGAFTVGPSLLGIKYPSLAGIPTVTPVRYVPIVNDQTLTTWGGILNNPLAQATADVFKSLYTSSRGDMLAVDLTIVGDPHLIRQDDWLVSPTPGSKDYFSKFDQGAFARKYGFLRFDTSDLIVEFNLYTPVDQDADLTARGLMFFPGGSPAPVKSLFSGQYRIITIKNKFEAGKFEQVLKIVRINNSDFATALADKQDAVNRSTTNQTNNTNR